MLCRPLFGRNDALTFLGVIYGPKVAVIFLLDDGLVDEVAELSLHLACINRLRLRLSQLLFHLGKPGKLGLGFLLLALFLGLVSSDLGLGAAPDRAGLHQVAADALGG